MFLKCFIRTLVLAFIVVSSVSAQVVDLSILKMSLTPWGNVDKNSAVSFWNISEKGKATIGSSRTSLSTLKAFANENYVYDSTIGYKYNGAADSVLFYKSTPFINGTESKSNVVFTYAAEKETWNRQDSICTFYDELGREIEYVYYEWDIQNGIWISHDKYESAYNGDGFRILNASYSWNAETEEWEGQQKDTTSYLDYNRVKSIVGYIWDYSKGGWLYHYKEEHEYDEELKSEIITFSDFNSTTGEWEQTSKYKKETIEEQNPLIVFTYNWNGDGWDLNQKEESYFDEFGNQFSYTTSFFRKDSQTWVGSFKLEGEFLGENLWTKYIGYYWNIESNTWLPSFKSVKTYNESLEAVSQSDFSWNPDYNDWQGVFKTIESLSEGVTGLRTVTYTNYKWDDSSWDWEPDVKYLYYYHQPVIAGLQNREVKQKVTVFPNPVQERLMIRGEDEFLKEIKLYSASGNLLKNIDLKNEASVDIPFEYPKGVYFVRVNASLGIKTFRVVK